MYLEDEMKMPRTQRCRTVTHIATAQFVLDLEGYSMVPSLEPAMTERLLSKFQFMHFKRTARILTSLYSLTYVSD